MAGMLEGKVALITGGGRGIGRQTALLFAREGARVVVADLSADGAKETVGLIEKAGGQTTSVIADVAKPDDITAMMVRTVEIYGRLDCAFNNAGVNGAMVGQAGKRTGEWSEEGFDKVIQINLKGVWLCMRAELQQMVRQGHGSIVNTASVAGLTGFRYSSGYVASKHGVVGLTKTAALEYAPEIRVNCVVPGHTDTDFIRDTMTRRGPEILASVPFGELAKPDDIAEMVCWLSSDRARYVSGAAFNVDGALTAG